MPNCNSFYIFVGFCFLLLLVTQKIQLLFYILTSGLYDGGPLNINLSECFLLQDFLTAAAMLTNSCLRVLGHKQTQFSNTISIWFTSEMELCLQAALGHLLYKRATDWCLLIMKVEKENWIHLQPVCVYVCLCVHACVRVFVSRYPVNRSSCCLGGGARFFPPHIGQLCTNREEKKSNCCKNPPLLI